MKITPIFLATILAFSTPTAELPNDQPVSLYQSHIVEDNYYPSDTYRIIKNKNSYDKLTVYGREHYKQTVQSTKEILNLPVCLDFKETDESFLLPSEIDGIVMDIPFNYYSSLEASVKYFQTLLHSDWEIEYFNATSLCVQIGLVRDDVTCRLLIYEDYLKVYCKLI